MAQSFGLSAAHPRPWLTGKSGPSCNQPKAYDRDPWAKVGTVRPSSAQSIVAIENLEAANQRLILLGTLEPGGTNPIPIIRT